MGRPARAAQSSGQTLGCPWTLRPPASGSSPIARPAPAQRNSRPRPAWGPLLCAEASLLPCAFSPEGLFLASWRRSSAAQSPSLRQRGAPTPGRAGDPPGGCGPEEGGLVKNLKSWIFSSEETFEAHLVERSCPAAGGPGPRPSPARGEPGLGVPVGIREPHTGEWPAASTGSAGGGSLHFDGGKRGRVCQCGWVGGWVSDIRVGGKGLT